jgi:hypothetical protein
MFSGLFRYLQLYLPNEYQTSVPCKLIVECSITRSGKLPEFLVTIVGHPNSDFRFRKADLDAYILGRGLLLEPCGVVLIDNQTSAIDYLEAGLLNILQTTGFGDVLLIFQKGCFVCKVTFSYRQYLKI